MARKSKGTPIYFWDERVGRYRDTRTGRYVKPERVRAEIDRMIAKLQKQMQASLRRVATGKLTLDEWQLEAMAQIKKGHIAMWAVARGGTNAMTQSDALEVGRIIGREYRYLNRFARAMEAGALSPGNQAALVRIGMYATTMRQTYEGARRAWMGDHGFTQERSVLGIADHCPGCMSEAAKGWVPIDTLIPIGQRDCKMGCKCSIEYRK